MKDLHQHTRISPAVRAHQLEKFMNELQSNTEAQKEQSCWKMCFDKNLLQMQGRVLPAESKSIFLCKFFADFMNVWCRGLGWVLEAMDFVDFTGHSVLMEKK